MMKTSELLMTVILAVVFGGGGLTSASAAEADGKITAWALYEPCSTGSGRATPELLRQLSDPVASRRVTALGVLARDCIRPSFDAVLAALRDDDPLVRIAAIEAIGTLRDPGASDEQKGEIIAQLLPLAHDADWRVRAALSRTLASFHVYQASNAVLNLIANPGGKRIVDEGDLRARCQAILMVNQLRDVRFSRKGIGFLFGFSGYPEPALRAIAAETAGQLKFTRNGYHELIGIAKKPGFPGYRVRAIEWLADWKMVEARPALEELAANEADLKIREAAVKALTQIGASR
jgi:HEAT repeat protein